MIDYEDMCKKLAQSISAALFAVANENDLEKAEEILQRAEDICYENDLL